MRFPRAALRHKRTNKNDPELVVTGVKKRVPDAAFVGIIDRGLRKHDPEATVPWARMIPPAWVRTFEPESVLDLGCGLGAFTSSVLQRLGQWNRLDKLEQITLIEREPRLNPRGAAALRDALVRRVSQSTRASAKTPEVQVFVKAFRLPKSRSHPEAFPPLGKQRFDLIVASHVTYYFGESI